SPARRPPTRSPRCSPARAATRSRPEPARVAGTGATLAPMPPPFYTFVGIVSWPVTRFAYRLKATGIEHVPKEGGFVLAANHTSNFDPWPLGMPLFPRRTLRFMAKVELFNPILSPLLRSAGAFPVRRGQADFEAIETAVRLVRDGEVVVM